MIGLNGKHIAIIGFVGYLVHHGQFIERGRYFRRSLSLLMMPQGMSIPRAANPYV